MKMDELNQSEQTRRIGKVSGNVSGVLRLLAGQTASVRRDRRGTFLVLVVGTLALLAVIAVVHFAIGQADRRTSAALVRGDRLGQVPEMFADHVKQIISDDLFETISEDVNQVIPNVAQHIRRFEGFDFASGDWRNDSTHPTPYLNPNARIPDPRYFKATGIDCDPWLASLEPTWLEYKPDGQIQHTAGRPPYADERDWDHISNVSPDGRYVNLYNLRNNFDAESGFGTDQNNRVRTSANLSILDDQGRMTRAGVTNDAVASYWSSRQTGAFRASKSNFVANDPNAGPARPGNPGMQWADTDGDGWLDARFQEMVDVRDQNAPWSLIPRDGRVRWFFATRIVDLSGMINVNTAGDLTLAPKAGFPIGITPADIDLKRLLSLQDSYAKWNVGYESLTQPLGAGNYQRYTQQNAVAIGSDAYSALRRTISTLRVPDPTSNWQTWSWVDPRVQPGVPAGQEGVFRSLYWRGSASSFAGADYDQANTQYDMLGLFGASDLSELLTRHGSSDEQVGSRLEQALSTRPPLDRQTPNLSVLRNNRGPEVELPTLDAQGQATPAAYLAAAIDPRRRMTPLSGARPLGSARTLQGTSLNSAAKFDLTQSFETAAPVSSSELFRTYAAALAPALGMPGCWPRGLTIQTGGPDYQQRRTLFYGHTGPELPLILAANLAMNMATATAPAGNSVMPGTLVLDRMLVPWFTNNRQPLNAEGLPAFPFFVGGVGSLPMLDQESRPPYPNLASSEDGEIVRAPAITVFGTDAQAFITEVGSFTVYTDATLAAGGDRDYARIQGGGQPDDPAPPPPTITINGDVTDDNDDLLLRVVAFQLHNPFDAAVTLSTITEQVTPTTALYHDPSFHYIRLCDRQQAIRHTFKIGRLNDDTVLRGDQISGISIPAGGTVVCYATSRPLHDVAHRINLLSRAINTDQEGLNALRTWLHRQLGDGVRAGGVAGVYHIPRVDFGTNTPGSGRMFDTFDELVNSTLVAPVVQLWKSQRADMTQIGSINEIQEVAAGRMVANLPGNDRLVDRFRVPATRTLDRRASAGNQDVSGTNAGREIAVDDPANDNSGYTATLWVSYQRPNDPQRTNFPRGGLPAYCVEPKDTAGLLAPWNKRTQDLMGGVTTISFARGQFTGTVAARTFSDWLNTQQSSTLSQSIAFRPDKKTTAANPPSNRASRPFVSVRPEVMWQTTPRNTGLGNALPFRTPLPGNPAGTFAPTIRATDLLLASAVAAYEAPVKPGVNPRAETNPNARYTTIAEAWALATGYERLPAPTVENGVPPLYENVPGITNGVGNPRPRPVLDTGHLVLDDFAPFFDTARNGKFDPDADYRFGLGIPCALGIMDATTSVSRRFADHERAAVGVLNVNTASLGALRCLPWISPAADQQWGTDLLWNAPDPVPDREIDIAAAMASYRDKRNVEVLPNRGGTPAITNVYFADSVPNQPNNPLPPINVSVANGRALHNRIEGIREAGGFKSLGEMLCVFERQGFTVTDPWRKRKTGIDHIATNGANNSALGVDSYLHKSDPADPLSPTFAPNELNDDYAEKLQIAAGLMNTTSVRSDLFAVWFVVRGYTRQDCEDLTADDPMVASVERRFVMIVDRSSVTQKGQPPKMVMFKEVPL